MNSTLPVCAALLAGVCPMAAQTTYLSEDFAGTAFPPSGWSEKTNGVSDGWEVNTAAVLYDRHAFHDDYYGYNDNHLVAPNLDLGSASGVWLHAKQYVHWASYRDHHYVDVSLDGGLNFTTVHDDLAWDGRSDLTVNFSAYAGLSGVKLSFHYTGDYASEWSIDNVLVNDSPNPPPPAVLASAVNPANGHTYHLFEPSSWTAAEAAAVGRGGHLATVRSASENAWLAGAFGNYGGIGRYLWIGLNDAATEGQFRWSSGEPLGYSNWMLGEPNNALYTGPEGEDYVHLEAPFGYYANQWLDDSNDGSPWNTDNVHGVAEVGGPRLSALNLVAGQTATVGVEHATPGGLVYFAYSFAGGGPINTPWGTALLSQPYRILPPVIAGPLGNAALYYTLPAVAKGRAIWIQAFDRSTHTPSNGLAEVIG